MNRSSIDGLLRQTAEPLLFWVCLAVGYEPFVVETCLFHQCHSDEGNRHLDVQVELDVADEADPDKQSGEQKVVALKPIEVHEWESFLNLVSYPC